MNLNELFKPQAKLDNHVIEKHKLQGQDLLEYKIEALHTEVSECSNERRTFKFWSDDKKPRTKVLVKPTMNDEDKEYYNPLLEEYIDCVHFTLSIANDLGYLQHQYKDPGNYSLSRLVNGLHSSISLLETRNERHMSTVFNLLIKLGYSLGFDEHIVKQAYYEKNKINHNRQKNGY